MPFNIETFRHYFSGAGEISKTSLFDVFISVPTAITQASGTYTGLKELSLQCEVSELPSRDIQMIEYRHYAFIKRIPHMNQYSPITFTFFCTGNLNEKILFDTWLDCIIPADTGIVNYPEDSNNNNMRNYEADITVNQYDTVGNLNYAVQLIDAVPIAVAAMGQNWSDDSPHRLSVTFAYMKWISSATNQGQNQVENPPVGTNTLFPSNINNANPPQPQAITPFSDTPSKPFSDTGSEEDFGATNPNDNFQ